MRNDRGIKRVVGGIYSAIADNLYEPIVVQGAFRVFGRHLHETIRERSLRAAAMAAGEPILDMPVGTGYFTLEAARQHAGVMAGVDLAEGMVREAKQAARRAGANALQVLRGDAHRLPFRDETFAVILCWNGLQVIPGIDATVNELARVLKPGGTLFASTVNLPLGDILSARRARRLPPMVSGRRRFVQALSDAGLQIESAEKDRLATILAASKRD